MKVANSLFESMNISQIQEMIGFFFFAGE